MLFNILEKIDEKIIDHNLEKNKAFLLKLIKRGEWNLVAKLDINLLINTVINGKSCLEMLFRMDLTDSINCSQISSHNINTLINLCKLYNKNNLLKKINSNLFDCIIFNGKTLLEYLFENDLIDEKSIYKCNDPKLIFELCKKYDKLSLLSSCNADVLLSSLQDGMIILDYVLKNNLNVDNIAKLFSLKRSRKRIGELLLIVSENKRYDILTKIENIKVFFKLIDLNKTVIDDILERFVNYGDVDITNITKNMSSFGPNGYKIRLVFAKYDLLYYIEDYSVKELLSKCDDGKTVIEKILDADSDLAYKIIPTMAKRNIEIALILRTYGIKQKTIDIPLKKDSYLENFSKEIQEEYHNMPITDEEEILLMEFRKLMMDGQSNSKLVELVIDSYRYLLSTKNPYGLRDLNYLIQLKKDNPSFAIKKIESRAYYNGNVFIGLSCIPTLHHELGHALHDKIAHFSFPENFENLIENISNNPVVLERFSEFNKVFYSIKKQYIDDSINFFKNRFDETFTNKKKKEIKKQLRKDKKSKYKEYIKIGYKPQIIKAILDSEFSIQSYKSHYIRINSLELINLHFHGKYSGFGSICDIVDAIYDGKLYDGKIDKYNLSELSTPGHGISYYYKNNENKFTEMIANYSQILKSPDCKELIEKLTYIVGPELVSMLQDYYDNTLVMNTSNNITL